MKTILVVLNKTKRQDKIMKLANENNYFREKKHKNSYEILDNYYY